MAFALESLGTWQNPDVPEFEKIDIVKNEAFDKLLKESTGQLGATQRQGETDIENFMRQYRTDTPAFSAYNKQAIGQIDRLFSPQFEAELTGMRQAERQARMAALKQTQDRLTATSKATNARLGVRGGNSFLDLQNARLQNEAATQANLADAAQARADWNQTLQARLGSLGTRQDVLAAEAQRTLQPSAVQAAVRAQPLGSLAQIIQMDQANRWQGLAPKKTVWDKIAETSDWVDEGGWDVYNIMQGVMSIGGGMGGGM